MPEMHLRHPEFACSACRPFTKNKELIQNIKETRDLRYIYQDELDKACFQHDITYRDFKGIPRNSDSDKVLSYKAFNVDKNLKYDGYQRCQTLMVYINILPKKTSNTNRGTEINSDVLSENKQLAKELHKPVKTKSTLIFYR